MALQNKLDENDATIRSEARLVAQNPKQEEGIDFKETFTPVLCLEATWTSLAFSSYMNFKLFQMDFKSAIQYITNEVYVEQPPGFEDKDFPHHVYKLKRFFMWFKTNF